MCWRLEARRESSGVEDAAGDPTPDRDAAEIATIGLAIIAMCAKGDAAPMLVLPPLLTRKAAAPPLRTGVAGPPTGNPIARWPLLAATPKEEGRTIGAPMIAPPPPPIRWGLLAAEGRWAIADGAGVEATVGGAAGDCEALSYEPTAA